jgi:hypothetical protein
MTDLTEGWLGKVRLGIQSVDSSKIYTAFALHFGVQLIFKVINFNNKTHWYTAPPTKIGVNKIGAFTPC